MQNLQIYTCLTPYISLLLFQNYLKPHSYIVPTLIDNIPKSWKDLMDRTQVMSAWKYTFSCIRMNRPFLDHGIQRRSLFPHFFCPNHVSFGHLLCYMTTNDHTRLQVIWTKDYENMRFLLAKCTIYWHLAHFWANCHILTACSHAKFHISLSFCLNEKYPITAC